MKKNKFSQKIQELPPPKPSSESNEIIIEVESENKENISPKKQKNIKKKI